jgi:hypothetical protein
VVISPAEDVIDLFVVHGVDQAGKRLQKIGSSDVESEGDTRILLNWEASVFLLSRPCLTADRSFVWRRIDSDGRLLGIGLSRSGL